MDYYWLIFVFHLMLSSAVVMSMAYFDDHYSIISIFIITSYLITFPSLPFIILLSIITFHPLSTISLIIHFHHLQLMNSNSIHHPFLHLH